MLEKIDVQHALEFHEIAVSAMRTLLEGLPIVDQLDLKKGELARVDEELAKKELRLAEIEGKIKSAELRFSAYATTEKLEARNKELVRMNAELEAKLKDGHRQWDEFLKVVHSVKSAA